MGNPKVTSGVITLKDQGGGVWGSVPPSTASAELRWDIPVQYTDNSTLIDMDTFRVKYGPSTGSYTDNVILSSTDNKGALSLDIDSVNGVDVEDGQSVFAVVSTISANGNESSESIEVEITASDNSAPDISGYTVISSLPYTASTPGGYRLDSNLIINSGAGITIGASDVIIDLNGRNIIFAETGDGTGITLDNFANTTIRNGSLTKGTFIPSSSSSIAGIFRNGSIGENLTIDGINIDIGNCGNISGSKVGGIYISNMVNARNEGHIKNCNITLHDGFGLTGITLDGIEWYGRISNNDISISNTIPGNITRPTALNRPVGSEVYLNTVTADQTTIEAAGITSFGSTGGYWHDNTFNMDILQGRAILIDGDSQGIVATHNTINMLTPSGAVANGTVAGIRVRFGSSDNIVGLNTITGTATDQAYGMYLGGRDGGTEPAIINNYFHNNDTNIGGTGLNLLEGVDKTDLWDNTWKGDTRAMLARGDDIAGLDSLDNITFNSDEFDGIIFFNTITQTPQTITTNFVICDKIQPTGTYSKGVNVLDDIDSFLTSGPCPLPNTKTPKPPTNLRAG